MALAAPHSRTLSFTCNLCGSHSELEVKRGSGYPNCPECGSIARWRAVVYVLSVALFGEGLTIPEFPHRPHLAGIGLSDPAYAEVPSSKLAYRNSFYDREPRLDITDPPRELHGTLDFLIASDVFEHVAPPVGRAFEGALRLLKPGGVFIVTVPGLPNGETREHFPNLHEYEILDFHGRRILVNRTAEGRWEVFDDFEFHDGVGVTLEMRVFSHPSLLQYLRAVGFDEITEWTERRPEFGLPWLKPNGLPVNGPPRSRVGDDLALTITQGKSVERRCRRTTPQRLTLGPRSRS